MEERIDIIKPFSGTDCEDVVFWIDVRLCFIKPERIKVIWRDVAVANFFPEPTCCFGIGRINIRTDLVRKVSRVGCAILLAY